jgi:hypothetical protein
MQTENMQSAGIGKLTEAVCSVMAGFRGVEKSGKNSFHGYKYASDADILWMLKPLLAEHGLSVMLVSFAVINVGEIKTNNGKTERLIDLCVTYRLSHKSGEWVLVQSPGSGQDPGDKAHYKAMTGALKYALRQTFAIPTGDDPEADEPKGNERGNDRGGNQRGNGQRENRRDDRREEPAREDRRQEPQREERPAQTTTDKPKLTDPNEQLAWLLDALLKLDPKFTALYIAKEWRLNPPQLTTEHIGRLRSYLTAETATRKAASASKEAP